MVESITNPTFYVWRSLRHHKIFPFRDIILKDADRRVQEFKSKYPWYTNDYCILPVHAYNTLTEFLRLRGQDHFKRVHQIPYERELATIKKAPKISELRSLLHYETEYGIVWDGKGWHAIAGDDRCVPFNGRDFPDNGIFIHNHLLKIKDDLSSHHPFPSYFDLIQEKGRHFLVTRLGIIQYKVFHEDEEDAYCTWDTHRDKPRFLKMKLDKEELYKRGIILQKIRWENGDEDFFMKLAAKPKKE